MPDPIKVTADLTALTFTTENADDPRAADFYDKFLAVAEKIALARAGAGAASVPAVAAPPAPAPAAPAAAAITPPPPPAAPVAPGSLEPESDIFRRTFIERDGVVTMAALPQTAEATRDAILALLFAFLKKSGQSSVTAPSLAKSLRLSGLETDALDRQMKPLLDRRHVTRSGVGRGTVYNASNSGLARAEEIIRAIHGS